jgi:hypothetical protein
MANDSPAGEGWGEGKRNAKVEMLNAKGTQPPFAFHLSRFAVALILTFSPSVIVLHGEIAAGRRDLTGEGTSGQSFLVFIQIPGGEPLGFARDVCSTNDCGFG